MRWPKRREIYNRQGGTLYLTRWYLVGPASRPASQTRGWPGLMLHKMHRPDDGECHHDHPWSFWTLVLYGGYVEEVTMPDGRVKTRRNRPGMLLFRPAEHTHRIADLPRGVCYTLVLRWRKRRSWGFHTPRGFIPWRRFSALGAVAWCDDWIRERVGRVGT